MNPSKKTFEKLIPLINEAYEITKDRFEKRTRKLDEFNR